MEDRQHPRRSLAMLLHGWSGLCSSLVVAVVLINCLSLQGAAGVDIAGQMMTPINFTIDNCKAIHSDQRDPYCEQLGTVNMTNCLLSSNVVSCLNQTNCLHVYNISNCVGLYNWTLANFNKTHCLAMGNLGISWYRFNATDCHKAAFFNPIAAVAAVSAGVSNISNASNDTGNGTNVTRIVVEEREEMEAFTPCSALGTSARLEKLDFFANFQPFLSFFAIALSPDYGPVHGGTVTSVCGTTRAPFPMSNENINMIQCKFTDGYNTRVVGGIYVDAAQIVCVTPDFSHFSIGLPHKVNVEISFTRGRQWTNNGATFTYFSTRPSINAFGYPAWGYDPEFRKASWEVSYPQNEYGWKVDVFYPPSKHPAHGVAPNSRDSLSDPYHVDGEMAEKTPTRGEPIYVTPEDVVVQQQLNKKVGIEGSWGDPNSFMRAHFLVKDQYRKERLAAQVSYSNGLI